METRKPIKVVRKPITVATENNYSLGNWFPFPKPDEEPPYMGKLKKSQRVLWCPWCGEWQIFDRSMNETSDAWKCTGYCGWGNSNEYYTRYYNNLWFEDVPMDKLKKLVIPAPAKKR